MWHNRREMEERTSIKPVVEQAVILALLRDIFGEPIEDLAPVAGGITAQTLSFKVGAQEYILRFTTSSIDASYQKEAFIYQHFATARIPIPPVLKVGQLRDVYYAVSRKLPGRGLEFLSRAEYEQTVPSIVETLVAIHQVDVSRWQDYGWLDDSGIGMFPSWHRFIARIIEEERPDGFYGKWHELFRTSFLEREFFESVYGHLLRLLQFCPEERYLVHGEYGYNNVLALDGRVTAVLDWIDAMYGDPLYDVAVLSFWPRHDIDFPEILRQHYSNHGMVFPHYWERIVCYQCYMGLDALRFFAKTNDRKAYESTCQILRKLLT